MMQTQFYTPHILLRDFINCIMIVHAEVDPDTSSICIYPPTPQHSIFFYINDRIKVKKAGSTVFTDQPRSVIVGLQSAKVTLDINKSHKAVRVGFHPGGLYRLIGMPMAGLIDGSYDAADIFGKGISEVNEKLQDAKTFEEIKNTVEDFLLQKLRSLKRNLPFDSAMLEMLRFNGNISMEKMASLSCLSLRQFERISKERIGVSPKFFARLIRFSQAYRLFENSMKVSWTSIAHQCGYFDQMHFIRDFKEFAGVAPGLIEKELNQAPVRLQASMRL